MIETLFKPASVVARFWQEPLGPYLEELATTLIEQQYSRDVVRCYLWSVANFGKWLSQQELSLSDVDETVVGRYLSGLKRRPSGGLSNASGGLTPLLKLLRRKGAIASSQSGPAATGIDQWLTRFERYLEEIRGIAPVTRQRYHFFIRRFMGAHFERGEPDWSSLHAQEVADFVCQEARTRTRLGRKSPGVAMRVFLRFLVASGEIPLGLEAAVPIMRQPTHAALPRQIPVEQVEQVLKSCQDEAPKGLRNHAILLLLARLGLRAKEIISLRLEDIDWREGSILVRAGKTHRERRLPLPQEAGQALAAYLGRRRPNSHCRVIFLRLRPPFLPLAGGGAITHIAQRSLQHIGLPVGKWIGAHSFRHTVASAMVCQGASFKDVADVLGHQCLHTTGIYAKLDVPSLAQIALPWPGGAQ